MNTVEKEEEEKKKTLVFGVERIINLHETRSDGGEFIRIVFALRS